MRSSQDVNFSNICDRVARGRLLEEDELFLKSRIQDTDSENSNEAFKLGNISIIVTVNKKRNLINSQKLSKLLPFEKLYVCNSTDRVKNVPGSQQVPDSLRDNPGKTGNLESELNLKVGAPVVITTNHAKQKYKDDGIMNGARGFVQAIQVAKDEPEKVIIVWIVFNNDNIGKLYRAEHKHLRKEFNPQHHLATPILPQRQNFTRNFGNVEYQRTNFPLSLAYAITSHKCQGDTLQEVVIDFGPDEANKIKFYVCAGSFYVALTRVKMGSKVFLKSFDKKYIKVDPSIEQKVDAMRKFRPYKLKKIYLDEEIFRIKEDEIKLGYLNINGLCDGQHAEYLNADLNLLSLDILVLSETKLVNENKSDQIETKLNNWRIIGRYDSEDGSKHMGMMLLVSKKSKVANFMKDITHQTAKREDNLQIQGLVVRMNGWGCYGFIYCRTTPTNGEVKGINKYFKECDVLMGDLNLSNQNLTDQEKLSILCQNNKVSLLDEITRSISNNQLDYILVNKSMKENCFVTSYSNFISDHKAIVARIGSETNSLSDETKERIFFDTESHLKERHVQNKVWSPTVDSEEELGRDIPVDRLQEDVLFSRRIRNPDMATCWLNSCLQLLLTAMDYDEYVIKETYNSELGEELLKLHSDIKHKIVDPTKVKDIIVSAEDERIATRLSELSYSIIDKNQLSLQSQNVHRSRLNLGAGQQCVRDFFICLTENLIKWPDVFSTLAFRLTNSSECMTCGNKNSYETTQVFLELDVPPSNEDLKDYVEDYLNKETFIGRECKEICKKFTKKKQKNSITELDEVNFFTVILTRGIETVDGYHLVPNKILSTNTIKLRWAINYKLYSFLYYYPRDSLGIENSFEVVAVIEYQGRVNTSGQSAGHYICDVKEKSTGNWFRTNDNKDPVQIDQQNVSTCAYVVLYRKVIT